MNGFEWMLVGIWIGAVVGWMLRPLDRTEAGSAIVSDDELAAADAARRVWEQTL